MTVQVAVSDGAEGATAQSAGAAEAQLPGGVSRRLPPVSPVPAHAGTVPAPAVGVAA